MIDCRELAGKVIRSLTIFEDGRYGPEISIDFEDGSNFNACLGIKMTLEAQWTRHEGGEPQNAAGLHNLGDASLSTSGRVPIDVYSGSRPESDCRAD